MALLKWERRYFEDTRISKESIMSKIDELEHQKEVRPLEH